MARTLFGPPDGDPQPKPSDDRPVRMQVMITVKAAPNPSERYGETVCVAGIRAEMTNPGWIRLYPINFRDLTSDETFRKYQLITLEAIAARGDQRRESFRPILPTIVQGEIVEKWPARRAWLDDYLEDSMCRLNADVKDHPDAKSLSLIRPREVSGMRFEAHPGWSLEEQRKIDRYVGQLDLLDSRDRTPLQPPRFKGWYRYHCYEPRCRGHEQGILDWEFVMLQRRLVGRDDAEVQRELRAKFQTMMCSPRRDVAFYVGNQAKRVHVFSVLGVYYPPC